MRKLRYVTIFGILLIVVLLLSFSSERQIDLNSGDRRVATTCLGVVVHSGELAPFKDREYMPGGVPVWCEIGHRGNGAGSAYPEVRGLCTIWDLEDKERRAIYTFVRDTFLHADRFPRLGLKYFAWHGTTAVTLAERFESPQSGVVLYIEPYHDVVYPPVKQLFRIKPDSYPYILDQKYIVGSGESYCWLLWNVTELDLSPDDYSLVEDSLEGHRIDEACESCGFDVDTDSGHKRYRAEFDGFELLAIPVLTNEGDSALVMRLLKVD